MKLKDIMTTNAECCEPSAPIAEIAGKMRDYNVGSIPVCENGKLTGIVSDRDIVIRCVAENETDAAARDIMSTQLLKMAVLSESLLWGISPSHMRMRKREKL